jgi:hypothetical protein
MMLMRLLSLIPFLRQQCVIYVSERQIRALDINNGSSEALAREERHPRTLTGNFNVLEREFRTVVGALFPRRWIKSDILICLSGKDEGGYTDIEKRVFRGAAFAAGAKGVVIATQEVGPGKAKEVFQGRMSVAKP